MILYRYRWLVLLSFFLSSSSLGSVQGSLSTTKKIILNISDELDENTINIAKYSDLVIYFPANFFSIWLIENYGLRACICLGSLIMLIGSIIRFLSVFNYMYFWYFGHIICMSSGVLLKSPIAKLVNIWFGDKERGFAISIGNAA